MLATLERPTIQPAESTARHILSLILRHEASLVPGGETGYGRHLARLQRFVAKGAPVQLVLPAFPAKSANREKTLGPLPDLAEVLGLRRLQELCDGIQKLHKPGAEVIICSDGRVFSDLVLVREEDVNAYGGAIDKIIADFGFLSLRTMSMDDVFAGDFREARARLLREYGRPLAEIREEVRNESEARMMFNGIHRFLFEDRLVLDSGKSRSQIRDESKDIAYQVIQRSNAWSQLVEAHFPDAVRLSIHPQVGMATKIGFRLVDCANVWGTPWHNVALLTAEGFRLVKRKAAEQAGAELALAYGKYPFYRERGL